MTSEKRFYLFAAYGLEYLSDGFTREEMRRHIGSLDHDYGFNEFADIVPSLFNKFFGNPDATNTVPYNRDECPEPMKFFLIPSFSPSKTSFVAVQRGPRNMFYIASNIPIGKPYKIHGIEKQVIVKAEMSYSFSALTNAGDATEKQSNGYGSSTSSSTSFSSTSTSSSSNSSTISK